MRCGPARRAAPVMTYARSTSRSSTRSSTCAAISRSWKRISRRSSARRTCRWRTPPTCTASDQSTVGVTGPTSSIFEVKVLGGARGRSRIPLLGRLCRVLRRSQPQGHDLDGPSAARGRTSTSPSWALASCAREIPARTHRQRVRLPGPRAAEHRDAQRPRHRQDHHPMPPLLQHAWATSIPSSAGTTPSCTTASC